jgi:hypothetical protein
MPDIAPGAHESDVATVCDVVSHDEVPSADWPVLAEVDDYV